MTDENTSIDIPTDTATAAGAGEFVEDQQQDAVDPTAEPAKAEPAKSAREMMEAELDKVQADDKDAKDKDAVEKPDAKADAKEPPKADKPEGEKSERVKPDAAPEEKDAKPSEGKVPEPPARFMPKAREVWANTPNPVKAEVARMEREFAASEETHREATKFREELKEYDDLAKQHNTSIKAAMQSYVETERRLHADPEGELPRVLKAVGMDPVQAVNAILRSVGSNAQQFAQHVMQNPGQYQQQQQQPQRQQEPQPDPVAARAMEEVQGIKRQLAEQQLNTSVIEPFKAGAPRFDELQEDIAFFLNSGRIPESLSVQERLEAAYDMAERINPASYRDAPQVIDDQPAALVNPDAGRKSIRGAPSGGKAPAMRTPSIRDALSANWPV